MKIGHILFALILLAAGYLAGARYPMLAHKIGVA